MSVDGGRVRAFVALGLPDAVREALAAEQQALRGALGRASWTRPEGIHLTLHFLGDLTADEVAALGDALPGACADVAPFEVAVTGLGVFPQPRRPRVLWAGIEAPPALAALHAATADALRACGLPVEGRRFRPHLTLARFRQRLSRQGLSSLVAILEEDRGGYGRFGADRVRLYRSELLPGGARYTVLHEARLGG